VSSREERHKYEADVAYEVWRSGGNPDNIDYERIQDGYYAGERPKDMAETELQSQRPRHQQDEEQQEQEL